METFYQVMPGLWLANLLLNLFIVSKFYQDKNLETWWSKLLAWCWITVLTTMFIRSLLDAIYVTLKGLPL